MGGASWRFLKGLHSENQSCHKKNCPLQNTSDGPYLCNQLGTKMYLAPIMLTSRQQRREDENVRKRGY
jgi:hypothetical protein